MARDTLDTTKARDLTVQMCLEAINAVNVIKVLALIG
jgi:hypothetical protein